MDAQIDLPIKKRKRTKEWKSWAQKQEEEEEEGEEKEKENNRRTGREITNKNKSWQKTGGFLLV